MSKVKIIQGKSENARISGFINNLNTKTAGKKFKKVKDKKIVSILNLYDLKRV